MDLMFPSSISQRSNTVMNDTYYDSVCFDNSYCMSTFSTSSTSSTPVAAHMLSGGQAKVRCPLCNTRTSVIYCANCIKAGKLSHSKRRVAERLVDMMVADVKHRGYMRLKEGTIEAAHERHRSQEELRSKVELKRITVAQLKAAVLEQRRVNAALKKKYLEVEGNNKYKRKINKVLSNNIKFLKESILGTSSKANSNSVKLQTINSELQELRQDYSEELITNVYPVQHITDVYIKDEVTIMRELEMAMEDMEIVHPSPPRTVHFKCPVIKVAGLLIPTSTNLLSFAESDDIFSDELSKAVCNERRSDGRSCLVLRVAAVLMNIAMLVNITAGLHGIILPNYLSHGDFNDHNISLDDLRHLIDVLHLNLIFLCISVGVPQHSIASRNGIIHNLLALMDQLHKGSIVRPVRISSALEELLAKVCPNFSCTSYCRNYSCKKYLPYRNGKGPHTEFTDLVTEDYHFVSTEDLSSWSK